MERKGSKRFGRYRNIMQSIRRRFSLRKKKDHASESARVDQWEEDTNKVRNGTCSFQVRYLGYIEVFDSRGMHICEEAVKALKAQCKGKYQRAVLYVSGDALRVVDEVSKSMIVDQTIEKVSFCAPDRHNEKAFAYICRDGTTRRWMCHGFLAVKESGERLSHAVGCAFAICLEKKQKRGSETGVTVTYNQSRTSFERTGSFRQTTLTERIVDPQSAILAEPVPVKSANNPYAVQRPHASANLLERQGSFRGFEKLNEISSPFKRTTSLRLNELPSTLQRQNAVLESPTHNGNGAVGGTIAELPQEQEDSIAQMCQQLTEGLSALTTDDPFSNAPAQQNAANRARGHSLTHQTSLPTPFQNYVGQNQAMLTRQHTSPASQTLQTINQSVNPWGPVAVNPPSTWGAAAAAVPAPPQMATINSSSNSNPFVSSGPAFVPQPGRLNNGGAPTTMLQQQQQQQNMFAHNRSHSIDTGEMSSTHWQRNHHQVQKAQPSATTMPHQVQQNGGVASVPSSASSNAAAMGSSSPWPTSAPPVPSSQGPSVDPFDVAWAAKSVNQSSANPFASKSVKKFEVQL
ncbi:protein numb [Aplysia californica]|uniref:Protein numb n=1 Tax=Aplysia californica TaxID=6500 RepID=A0ABM1A1W4_APLCA|nr:protein numb [Aplysia californica]